MGIREIKRRAERPPTQEEALAALQRYRAHPTERDHAIVQGWIAAAKGDLEEYARRIRLTA